LLAGPQLDGASPSELSFYPPFELFIGLEDKKLFLLDSNECLAVAAIEDLFAL
jgi:hypothetical protein